MSDSRRRSSRRGKKLGLYSVNDLVQIPHNSTTVIGRLAYKLTEQPSVRWLVSFDDIPSRKDEEIPEEAIGPVIARLETAPKTSTDSTSNGGTSSVVTPCIDSNTTSTINNDSITTRSLRRKSISGSNSSSSADDSTSKNSGKKRKGISFSASISKEEGDSRIGIAQDVPSLPPKISGRERRSRRRQGLIHEEVRQHTVALTSAASAAITTPTKVSGIANAGLSLTDKRSIAQNSTTKPRSDDTSRNKKAKFSTSDHPRARGKSEVIEVQFLTGTLYLYRGLKRHVEFIPKY